jgi:hypothetical protein
MRRFVFPSLVLFLAVFALIGCSTAGSTRPTNVAQPDIDANIAGPVYFGSGQTAPVTLEVTIRNNATVPLKAHQVELTSPGMTTYTLRAIRRIVNETIAPGDTRTITLFTQAYTTVRDPAEPLTLRTIVYFEANGAKWREIVQR